MSGGTIFIGIILTLILVQLFRINEAIRLSHNYNMQAYRKLTDEIVKAIKEINEH